MVVPLNRRRASHIRFPVRVPTVTEPVGAAADPDLGDVQNLSRSGVLLRLEKAITPGAPVRVTLRLHRRPPLTLMGTVVWVQPHPDFPGWALGIQFGEELPGEMVAEIADEEHPPWTPR
ncbi:MAG: PilZ domain-containing protein [candidate division NC10 bacterium]|nr:PilZ domain-containing protein [candidate division NC10 bacterium]